MFAVRQLVQAGYDDVSVLKGGMRQWMAARGVTTSGLESALMAPNDVVLSPSIRGSKEDMLNYLNWELKLKH